MVYEWDDHEGECYRLYVEERRPLDEVMQHMKDVHGFNPSKRAFQTQFRRWEFPSKQNPAHKNTALVDRIHQLWEANTSQKDMLRILNAEGHAIKERELMRVRAKHRWLLRVPNGTKTFGTNPTFKAAKGTKRKRGSEGAETMDGLDENFDGQLQELAAAQQVQNALQAQYGTGEVPHTPKEEEVEEEALSPEVLEKRQARLEKLQAESQERWANKKRRRRTRGWAGLPADPPGPPRFPSETTIDESKAFLHLDNELYRQLRDQFQGICEAAGFIKKTVAGPEKWQAAKDKLVAENAHLNREWFGPPNGVSAESKALALDVVCTDVTKRMRTLERRMTIAEAKNALHINPEQSREIRNEFYEVLKADHFTSKLEAGDEHWVKLKQKWIDSSALLQELLGLGAADPEHDHKLKAIEVLCRDVMKRLRDDQTKRDPTRKKQINAGPGPGPAPPKITRSVPAFPPYAPTASMIPAAAAAAEAANQAQAAGEDGAGSELQIDPSLLAAASDPSLDITLQLQQFAAEAAGRQEYDAGRQDYDPTERHEYDTGEHQHQGGAAQYATVPVYLRLNPASAVQAEPKIWLGMLQMPVQNTGTSSIPLLPQLISITQAQHPRATILKFWGVAPDPVGRESMYAIEREEDMGIYLQYVGDGKPTFSVQLAET